LAELLKPKERFSMITNFRIRFPVSRILITWLFLGLVLTQLSCQSLETKLSILIKSNNYNEVEAFLNANNVEAFRNKLDVKGKNAMHLAAETGNIEIINLLLRNNYQLTIKDTFGYYPLHYCLNAKTKNYIQQLLNKYLGENSFAGDLAEVKKLTEAGANINCKDDAGTSPIHDAVEGGSFEVYAFLKSKGADINQRGLNNGTILHSALLKDHENAYKIIEDVVNSAFDVNLTDWNKHTPLFYPTKNPQITKLLLDHKARIDVKDDDGASAIHYILRDETVESVKLLIKQGANINAKDNRGNTPLHWCGGYYCCSYCQEGTMIAYLISAGAQINAKNKSGITPLHVFAAGMYNNGSTHDETLNSGGIVKGVELLIKAGANVNAKDIKGRTPLHYAAESGNLQACELLIKGGAIKNAKMNDGTSPFMLAKKYDFKEIMELLGN
jgi:ankyrin repeat protein